MIFLRIIRTWSFSKSPAGKNIAAAFLHYLLSAALFANICIHVTIACRKIGVPFSFDKILLYVHHAGSFLLCLVCTLLFTNCFRAVWLPVLNPEGKSRRSPIQAAAAPPIKSHLPSKDYFKKHAV